MKHGCGCGETHFGGEMHNQFPLAISYVPMQTWTKTYCTDTALEKGTIFPDLYLPFLGKR